MCVRFTPGPPLQKIDSDGIWWLTRCLNPGEEKKSEGWGGEFGEEGGRGGTT